MSCGIAVIETHPIQYHAPVYREVQRLGVPITAIYSSDFSVSGYQDREFGTEFSWDTDLLSGYSKVFLSRTSCGGARSAVEASTRGLLQALQRLRPRAVLLTGYSPLFYGVAIWKSVLSGRPLMFRGETTDHTAKPGVLGGQAKDCLLRWMYRRFRRLLFVGSRSKHHYLRLGCHPEKLVFSPYCVDPSPFQCKESDRQSMRSRVRRELGLDEGRTVLLFSGKLVLRKAPELLLKAAGTAVGRDGRNPAVVFLGDGPMREQLLRMAAVAPQLDIRITGFQNQSKLSGFYHAADALVLPSRDSETWGLVVNDALHHGLPCIVSDRVGCAPDLALPGVTGEIFEADSSASLIAAVSRILKLIDRVDVRAGCRQLAAQYSVLAAAEGIARAFHETVTNKPQKHGRQFAS